MFQEINDLAQEKIISKEMAELYRRGDRSIEIPSLDELADDPFFVVIIVDASGSMEACENDVTKGHAIMLDALRENTRARHGRLFVSQYLFNSELNMLHTFTPLFPKTKGDQVMMLNGTNYVNRL